MPRIRFNRGVYLLEALNALATAFYFNYLFFFLKSEFAFTDRQNLLVGALNGFIYVPCALYGGKLGQKRGYLFALKAGLGIMCVALVGSLFAPSVKGLLLGMCIWTVGMCFTWPNLEALACDRQLPHRLPGIIGIYNVVWSGASAIAYFSGGAIAQAFGWKSLFWIPACIHVSQIIICLALLPKWRRIVTAPQDPTASLHESHPEGPAFLKMAWLANPFAYIAINATIPLIPNLVHRFDLSPSVAGSFCSIWFFARTITFIFLALWSGWHYSFRYLSAAYVGMVAAFATMLLATNFYVVVAVQILFGWCIGLIYYSSLYYSMHVGETKGEHGGIHEAAIGLGIFGGPAVGAVSLFAFPSYPQSSVVGVSLVVTIGFITLLLVRIKSKSAKEQTAAVMA